MLSTDRLDLLELFVRLAETGKSSVAADAIGIPQASVSRHIKRLESLLGTQLFQRTPRGMQLTVRGEELLSSAHDLLHEWDLVAQSARTPHRILSGRIRIAVSMAVGETIMAPLIARFLKKHPGLTIDLELTNSLVSSDTTEYDLWIRAGRIASEHFVVREVGRAERGVFCLAPHATASHPFELQQLQAVRLTPFTPELVHLTGPEGETYELRQKGVMLTNNSYSAYTAMLEGIGYAILPL